MTSKRYGELAAILILNFAVELSLAFQSQRIAGATNSINMFFIV